MAKAIGIDLGTTSVRVAIIEDGRPVIIKNAQGSGTTPSYVGRTSDGAWVVGEAARRLALESPKDVAFATKRIIGRRFEDRAVAALAKLVPYPIREGASGEVVIDLADETVTPTEVAAILLKQLKADAEAYLDEEVTQAIITVPAYFDDTQRRATRDAARIAGLDVLRLDSEPVMAALDYSFAESSRETVLVFDLGGGTLDVSVIDIDDGFFEVLSTRGDMFLGGEDFDYAIMRHLFDHVIDVGRREERSNLVMRGRLKHAAEMAKIDLSRQTTSRLSLPFLAVKNGMPLHLDYTLDRETLGLIISHLVAKAVGIIGSALKDAGRLSSDIDRVILVGGSTRMPLLNEKLAGLFGKDKIFGALRREDAVALGAAIRAGIMQGDIKDVVLSDVIPLSVGIETLGGVFTRLIDRNTTIPTKKSQVFSTAEDNQSAVTLRVFQGEQEMAADNKMLGQFNLEDIPPAPRGMPQIEVTFDIDANGLLSVSAKDKGTGKSQRISFTQTGFINEDEINVIQARLGDVRHVFEAPVGRVQLEDAPMPPPRELPLERAESAVAVPVPAAAQQPLDFPRLMFSYAREDADTKNPDKDWAGRIRKSFGILELQNRLEVFIDTDIPVGTKWEEVLMDYIARSNVVLLLLSPDFLGSAYIIGTELPAIFAESERRQVMLIPLHVRPSPYAALPDIASRQAFNRPEDALSGLSDYDVDAELTRLTMMLAEATAPDPK